MTYQCLCNGCLREVSFENQQAYYDAQDSNAEAFCKCGEVICGCDGCFETLNLLHAGVTDPQKLGLNESVTVGDLEDWTPENGIAE